MQQSHEQLTICRDSALLIGRDDLKEICYRGLGSGIGMFIESAGYDRHFSEKRASRIKKDILNLATLCTKSEKDFVGSCYKGLFETPFKKLYYSLHIDDPKINEFLNQN